MSDTTSTTSTTTPATPAAPAPKVGDLATRAMLASLSISQWSARKLDKKATAKTTSDAGADRDAARVNKYLLAGQDSSLKEVAKIATQARTLFYTLTQPWDDGSAILSADLWPRLNKELADLSKQFHTAVDAFLFTDYAQARDRARFALGALFDDADFPPPHVVRRKFAIEYAIYPMPVSSDFRVTLAAADAEMIRADIERRTTQRIKEAMDDAWDRLYQKVQHIATTLPAYDNGSTKKLYASMVENLRDLCEILPALNLARDPRLDELAAQAKAELAPLEIETLKASSHARAQATASANAILAAMSAHLGKPAQVTTPAPVRQTDPTVFDLFAPAIRAA